MFSAVILQIILIALNAMFASAEIAVISMNEPRMRLLAEEGNAAARRLLRLKEQPSRFLSTIQVAITLAGFLGSAFAADSFAGPLVDALVAAGVTISRSVMNTAAVLIITVLISFFSIVFGELVPKRIAMKNPDTLALKLSAVLNFVSKLTAPLVWLLSISTNGVLRLLGIDPNEEDDPVTEEEIRMLLMEGNEAGVIPQEENEIIQNVFEFNDTMVEQICMHRRDVVMLSTQDDMEEWARTIRENRHSFYPVCGEDPDDIIGVLDTKDYFRMDDQSREAVLSSAVDPAFFIPETMRANVLFRKMKQTRKYFAVVIDEYGGMSGIITLHDLLEALVGDLDEQDEPQRPEDIEKLGDNLWKIQGCAELDEIEEDLKIKFTEDDCDTFNGFICKLIDRIPDDGETFKCESEQLQIEVLSVDSHVVEECLVRVKRSQEDERREE